jgi:NAD-dependent DNA ligase
MTDSARNGLFLGAAIADRQVTQLIGIAQGLIADSSLNDAEVNFLHKWLVANDAAQSNPFIATLLRRIEEVLEDGVIDDDERTDLHDTIVALTASDFELGEIAKSTTLPLCDPAPDLQFDGLRYCFTGTFNFGKRADCEAAVTEHGAIAGSLTKKTNVLVIGEYATKAWKQEAFGRKIEKAAAMRDEGTPISIVSEVHWKTFIS